MIFPTDTLYGLAVDPANEEAVEKVFAVKQRAGREALPLIACDTGAVERLAALTPLARRLVEAFWPGPLTLILEDAGRVARTVHGGTGGLAIRVPASVVARGLARAAGGAVTATSANRSGLSAAASAGEAWAALAPGIDGVLDGGRTPGGQPSTIVDARGEEPVLVRAGIISYERVIEAMERR